MKYLIFDAGPLISLSMSGILDIIETLKDNFEMEFIITPQVKNELIDRPIQIKQYELEAVKVRDLLERGILKLSSDFVKNNILEREKERIINIVNSSFKSNKSINLIQEGEASCLAFSTLCNCDNLVVVDERTTRMLTESPEILKALMEKKLHTKINANLNELKKLKSFKFIRSSELIYIAYKHGLLEYKKDKIVLDAMLYAVKFKGAAISIKEIEEMKKLA